LIYFDIKIMDSRHKKHCGLPNETILENFKKLYARHLEGGVEVLPRIPLIPEITDTEENLTAIVSFYRAENVKKTQLLAYHPLWQAKNLKIGIEPLETGGPKMDAWMPGERVKACKAFFLDAGIVVE